MKKPIPALNLIFFASGFAGLIYESIWTHYLKLFLGHAAYAQTLVLGIFMGGMAVGAAVAARHTARIVNPLKLYAAIEVAIGIFALAFHPLFTTATGAFYDIALAQHLGGTPFLAAKWSLAALLILPQSILLGATFPVFSAAATRAAPASAGRALATLYFANSLGGALGCLASGFVMIPALGLPGTITAAGVVNLALGALVARLATAALPAMPAPRTDSPRFGAIPRLLVAVSFLTGATSFIYEIGWIRMLSLVLGSATHSFELMLCAFIIGLALGGLWIRKRIDSAVNPGLLLGYVQLAMGCAAIATIPLHNVSFDIIAWVIGNAPKTEPGYALLNLVRYGISSLIMFPAAFCAGMTLPLATRILLANEQHGEKAIGLIYSANTIGAISGLAFAVHVGLPLFGLNYLVASGALVDVLLGAALLLAFAGRARLRQALAVTGACVAGMLAAATTFDPQKLVSGVFRTGKASTQGSVVEIAHGRTATISVETNDEKVIIRTNGKPDASANVRSASAYEMDEVTMTLTGLIPLMLHQAPARVANIGFGSGITGETILLDPRVRQLDTIEIEPKMVKLARHFGALNRQVYRDPRSAIHIDDAKSFFATHGKTYDLIVSEPSNPWVSGVSGLFSVEFYRHVSRYLNKDGLFAQWIQIYETDPDRITSIIKAMEQSFDDYLVVALDYGDILLVAKPHGKVTLAEDGFAQLPPALQQRLRRLEIGNQSDLALRVIGNKAFFKPWLASRPVPANSDFAPYLDVNADRDRFIGKGWSDLFGLALSPYPITEVLGQRAAFQPAALPSVNRHFGNEPPALAARVAHSAAVGDANAPGALPIPRGVPGQLLAQGMALVADCRNPPLGDSPYALAALGIKVLPYLPPADGRALLTAMEPLPCFASLPPEQGRWRDLLRYATERNAGGFGAAAEDLLRQGQGATEVRYRYLLGMAMLGQLGAGNPAHARAVWEQYGRQPGLGSKPLSLELELLRAHAFAGADTLLQAGQAGQAAQ
jgi:spermidine synthase